MWLAIGFAATLTLLLVGFHNGLLASRSFLAVLTLMLVFAAVVLLMIDLDRPQEGLLRVSQQALLDLQRSINAPTP
jgi:galactitol-specific phosphotransferase system IIC component